MAKWIGIDFDGTLAFQEYGAVDEEIGRPLQPMIKRVRDLLRNGNEIKIFTARVHRANEIQDWLEKVGLPRLEVTNIKDTEMVMLFDDKAVQVERNTGELISEDGFKTLEWLLK